MGVYDNTESKYNVTGSSSSFSKLAPKRIAPTSIVAYGQSFVNNKIPKHTDETRRQQQEQERPENHRVSGLNLEQQRKSLPVYRLRKKLLEEIGKHESLIVIGETGSGKSTQIPQLLLENGTAGNTGCIGITQPRRVAAVSVARRVAQEQGSPIGKLVGYRVRFEDVTSQRTRIKYLTDGTMVREAIKDETLSEYSILILDEAHERSVQTDVLLGVARRAQRSRKLKNLPSLKLVVMSATLDADKFVEYFGAPVVYIEGRQHPVRIFHSLRFQEDYAFAALVTAFRIHREAPPNEDILIFLTGQEEIEATAVAARQTARRAEAENHPHLNVFPLYSALSTQRQLEAFEPSAPGTRKLVLSTNVAETSVTIGGIRHVIDTGVAKVRTHDPITGLDVLRVERIAKAQVWQRTGRAGREAPGTCYRTFTKEQFEAMKETPVAEIQRCCLAGVALQLLAIGIDPSTFDFIDKPPEESLRGALVTLEKLGATKGSPPRLSPLGRSMALLPLDPRFAKALLASTEYDCLEEALSVVALLSGESVFAEPPAKREEAQAARLRFASPEGDHVTLLNVYRAYEGVPAARRKAWCHENYLHYRNLEYGADARKQLARLVDRSAAEVSSAGENKGESLRRCLLEGLSDNLAELQRDRSYLTLSSRQSVAIHPSSTLHAARPPLVLFTEVVVTGRSYIRGLSVIEASWLSAKKDRRE